MRGVSITFLGLAFIGLMCAVTFFGRAGANPQQGTAEIHIASGQTSFLDVAVTTQPMTTIGVCASGCIWESTAADCWLLHTKWTFSNSNLAGNPTGLVMYVFKDNASTDHAANGQSAWGNAVWSAGFLNPASGTDNTGTFCFTHDGTNGTSARAGTYRLVTRLCDYVSPTGVGCTGTTETWDFSTDWTVASADGQLPTGYTLGTVQQGVTRAGERVTGFTDSNSVGGADVSTYTGGDAPTFRVTADVGEAPNGNETFTTATIPQAGGAAIASGATAVFSASPKDVTLATITWSDGYANNTSPTKRLTVTANAAIWALPWTHFSSAPAGMTLTSETQIDAAWGLVNKQVPIAGNCIVQDPDTSTTRPIHILHHFQTVLDRSCTVQDARGANLASGTNIKVFRRNANINSFGDTTDAASCTTTVGSAGSWQCDADTTGNSAQTHGNAFVLDIEECSTSACSTIWNEFTLAGRFDITSINNPGPIGQGDPIWVKAMDTNKGNGETLLIGLSYDNGTARTGAASNVTLYVRAPDATWAVNGANPTELNLGDGNPYGYYTYSFTASQEGTYWVFATAKTDLAETRSSPPASFRVLPYPASQDQVNATTSATNSLVNMTQLIVALNGVRVPTDSSVVLHMDFENDTSYSTRINDSSPYHNAGTITNANTATNYYVTGKDGLAVALDGVDDYIAIPANQSTQFSGAFSASAWVKTNSTAGKQAILSQNPDWSLYQSGTSIIAEVVGCPALTATSALPTSTWTHVVLTYDQTTITVYVNGAQSATQACAAAIPSTSQGITIGANASATSTQVWSGSIDKLRLYDRAVTSTEVTALYVGLNPALLTQFGSTGNWTASLTNGTMNSDAADLKGVGQYGNTLLNGTATGTTLATDYNSLLGATQYDTNLCANSTGCKVSDKTGFSLTSQEEGLIGNMTWWNTSTRTLSADTNFTTDFNSLLGATQYGTSEARNATGVRVATVLSSAISSGTFAAGALDGAWDAPIASHLTPGSTGLALYLDNYTTTSGRAEANQSRGIVTSIEANLTTLTNGVLGATQYETSELRNVTGAKVAPGAITSGAFGSNAIDANAFAQAAADKIWSSATRSLTDKTGFALTSQEEGLIGNATWWNTSTRTLSADANFTTDFNSVLGATQYGTSEVRNATGVRLATALAGSITSSSFSANALDAAWDAPIGSHLQPGSTGLALYLDNYTTTSGRAEANQSRGTMGQLETNLTTLTNGILGGVQYGTSEIRNATGAKVAAGAIGSTQFAAAAITSGAFAADALDATWDAPLGSHVIAGSAGLALFAVNQTSQHADAVGNISSATGNDTSARLILAASELTRLDTNASYWLPTIDALGNASAANTWNYATRTLTSGGNLSTPADVAGAVWGARLTDYVVPGTFGRSVTDQQGTLAAFPGVVDATTQARFDQQRVAINDILTTHIANDVQPELAQIHANVTATRATLDAPGPVPRVWHYLEGSILHSPTSREEARAALGTMIATFTPHDYLSIVLLALATGLLFAGWVFRPHRRLVVWLNPRGGPARRGTAWMIPRRRAPRVLGTLGTLCLVAYVASSIVTAALAASPT